MSTMAQQSARGIAERGPIHMKSQSRRSGLCWFRLLDFPLKRHCNVFCFLCRLRVLAHSTAAVPMACSYSISEASLSKPVAFSPQATLAD